MPHRHRRPSPASVIAFIALMIALGGTALAATGQIVNIGDGTTTGRFAKVDADGKLNVGDGSGNMTIDGNVKDGGLFTTFRAFAFVGSGGCSNVVTAPAGKALVIKDLAINALTVGTSTPYLSLNIGSGCGGGGFVQYVDLTGRGMTNLDFDPGLIVASGQVLFVSAADSTASILATGYVVPSSNAPATGTALSPPSPSGGPPPHPGR
jgi:hypothetical protein